MLSKPETEGTPKEFAVYLERICGQIRWKKAHPSIRRELSGHMEDQMAEYISAGIPPEEAAAYGDSREDREMMEMCGSRGFGEGDSVNNRPERSSAGYRS